MSAYGHRPIERRKLASPMTDVINLGLLFISGISIYIGFSTF